MSLPCPYRHVSYSTWRLNVFRTLFRGSEPQPVRTTLHPRDHPPRPNGKRNHSASRSFASDTETGKAKDAAAQMSAATAAKGGKNAGAKEFNPYSPEGREAMKNLLADLQAVSSRMQSDDPKEEASGQDNFSEIYQSRKRSLGDDQDTRESPRAPDAGDLEAGDGLHPRSGSPAWAREAARRPKSETSGTTAPTSLHDDQPPARDSPIFKWTRDKTRRQNEEKIHPSHHHVRGLKNNPWAEILASPIRVCQASGARLPVDLLLDLGYVKNPKDQKIYLVPANLADLDALEAKMAVEIARDHEPGPPNTDPQVNEPKPDQHDDEPKDEITHPQPPRESDTQTARRRPIETQSRLFSNQTFLEYLNRAVTAPPGKRGPKQKTASPLTRAREVLSNEVAKLVHFDGREAIHKAHHYIQNKRKFDAAVGGGGNDNSNASTHPSPVVATDAQNKSSAEFQLNKLQWQLDISSRIEHIMRRRILVALKALTDAEAESKAKMKDGHVSERPAGVIALPFPKRGMKGNELRALKATDDVSQRGNSLVRTVLSQEKQEEDDDEDEDENITPDDEPSSSTNTNTPPHKDSQYRRLGHPEWLPGSIFLHIGNKSTTSLFLPSSHPLTLPPLPPAQSNPLVPPMLPVMKTYRFPIFSLDRLFSHTTNTNTTFPSTTTNTSDKEAKQTLLTVLAHESFHRVEQGRQIGSDYLLFVRPVSGPTRAVIREVWKLWMYLGGENMGEEFWGGEGEGEGGEGEGIGMVDETGRQQPREKHVRLGRS